MKHLLLPLIGLLLLAGCTAQTSEEDFSSFWLILDSTHMIQDFNGTIVVLGGDVWLNEGQQLNGHLLMITGSMIIDGAIDGSLYALGGTVTINATAAISGNINVGGGEFTRHPNAQITGPVNLGDAPDVPSVATMTGSPVLDALVGFVIQTVPLLIFAAILGRWMPRSLQRIEAMIADHAPVSGATGVLVLLVGLSLLVAMAFTIVLIPVALISGVLLLIAVGMGWVALGLLVGRRITRLLPTSPGLTLTTVLGVLVFRVLFVLVEPIPFIGTVLVGLTIAVGMGAVLMTRFGQRTYSTPQADML